MCLKAHIIVYIPSYLGVGEHQLVVTDNVHHGLDIKLKGALFSTFFKVCFGLLNGSSTFF